MTTREPATSRRVPAAVRDRVFQRASYQCQFTGPDGTRCTARTGLQIEHTVPFGMRPEHYEPNLEILCALCAAAHNPYVQLVFTIPKIFRKAFLFKRSLFGVLSRAAYASTLDFLREHFPSIGGAVPAMVVAPQSFGSLLKGRRRPGR